MIRVPVNPELLQWTRERSWFAREEFAAEMREAPGFDLAPGATVRPDGGSGSNLGRVAGVITTNATDYLGIS